MKKVISILLIIILVFSVVLTGCGNDKPVVNDDEQGTDKQEGDDGKTYTIKCATSVDTSDPLTKMYLEFEKLLEERTDGRIQVEVFPNGELASANREQLEMCMQGTIQWQTVPTFEVFTQDNNFSELLIMDLPFLFDDFDAFHDFGDSDLMYEVYDRGPEALGIYIYPTFTLGLVNLGTTKGPVATPEDIKDFKIRTSLSDIYQKMVAAWGAAPTSIEWHESYTALQQGALEGMTTPTNLFVTAKQYEVLDYFVEINVIPFNHQVVINAEWFDSLPKDLQEIVHETTIDAIDIGRELEMEAEYAMKDRIKEKCVWTVPTPEQREQWVTPVLPIWEENADKIGRDFYDRALDYLGKTMD